MPILQACDTTPHQALQAFRDWRRQEGQGYPALLGNSLGPPSSWDVENLNWISVCISFNFSKSTSEIGVAFLVFHLYRCWSVSLWFFWSRIISLLCVVEDYIITNFVMTDWFQVCSLSLSQCLMMCLMTFIEAQSILQKLKWILAFHLWSPECKLRPNFEAGPSCHEYSGCLCTRDSDTTTTCRLTFFEYEELTLDQMCTFFVRYLKYLPQHAMFLLILVILYIGTSVAVATSCCHCGKEEWMSTSFPIPLAKKLRIPST